MKINLVIMFFGGVELFTCECHKNSAINLGKFESDLEWKIEFYSKKIECIKDMSLKH